MSSIISFSLFGSNPLYTHGMIKNAELAPSVYPGWKVVCYAAPDVPKVVTATLKKIGVELRGPVDGIADAVFWRFCVMDDAERFIVRDADSRLCLREALAVGAWIDGGLDWHVMRDHPHHWLPMGAGMWGAKGGLIKPSMREAIIKSKLCARPYIWKTSYGLDQAFLAQRVWPGAKKSCLQHDSCSRALWPEAKPFPGGINGDRFVGEVVGTDDLPHPEHWMMRVNERYAE